MEYLLINLSTLQLPSFSNSFVSIRRFHSACHKMAAQSMQPAIEPGLEHTGKLTTMDAPIFRKQTFVLWTNTQTGVFCLVYLLFTCHFPVIQVLHLARTVNLIFISFSDPQLRITNKQLKAILNHLFVRTDPLIYS